MRVIVTGGRDWTNVDSIRQALRAFPQGTVIVHGKNPKGADRIANDLAHKIKGLSVEPWPADWRRYGNAAGPIRNQAMVDSGADLCLGFPMPGSVGTFDCLQRANAAEIPCEVIFPDGERKPLDSSMIPAPRSVTRLR